MGAWDVGIFDNDTACDIKLSVEKGTDSERNTPEYWNSIFKQSVVKIDVNGRVVNDIEGVLAFASLQLEYNALQEEIKKEAIEIIDTGEYTNFSNWFHQEDIPKRKAILSELKGKLLLSPKSL